MLKFTIVSALFAVVAVLFVQERQGSLIVDGGATLPADATKWSNFAETAGAGGLTVLMPLPDHGFDPTEAAVPFATLAAIGAKVVFATETGLPSACDPRVLEGLLGGTVAKIQPHARELYDDMVSSDAFQNPLRWSDVDVAEFDGIFLTGGHAPGMVAYLTSPVVQSMVRSLWNSPGKTVGAVCHGVLIPGRTTVDPSGVGPSLLSTVSKYTAVPKYMERLGVAVTFLAGLPADEYQLSTTSGGYTEDELKTPAYTPGPFDPVATLSPGSPDSHAHAFAVRDGFFVTGRFWGDAYLVSEQFAQVLVDRASK